MVDKKIKILRIIARLNIGGPAHQAILLQDELDKDDFESMLLCGVPEPQEGDMSYLAQDRKIKYLEIPNLKRSINLWHDLRAFGTIYKFMRKVKPDIVHTHTAKAGSLGRLAAYILRVPVLVHTFHGHIFDGYFSAFKTKIILSVERWLAKRTKAIIIVSEKLKKDIVDKYRIAPAEKIKVIKLGFQLSKFLMLGDKIRTDTINIGIVGRLVPIKDHKFLFKAIKEIAVKAQDLKIKLSVIGDGELRDELEDEVKNLGMEERVEFLGWQKDLASIYNNLDIVVLSSLNEGTPVSLIEAMASGRPVISTNVGGVSDIVEDGKNGYLVENGDIEGFAKKIIELSKNPELRKQFGHYGREKVRTEYSKDRLVKDIKELYRSLL